MSDTQRFTEGSAKPLRDKPDRPCSLEQQTREMYGLPAEWQVVVWKAIEIKNERIGVQVQGGIYPEKITRGPRKGRTNYKKPTVGSELTCTITEAQQKEWWAVWENETGLCGKCEGTGVVFGGWNHEKGTTLRECKACNTLELSHDRRRTHHLARAPECATNPNLQGDGRRSGQAPNPHGAPARIPARHAVDAGDWREARRFAGAGFW